jgi:DNA-binding NarL/FixJ family response regulator
MNLNVAIIESDPGHLQRHVSAVRDSPDLRLLGTAGCGHEGQRLLGTFRPDVLLVGLQLPDLCASQLLRQACQRHPGIGLLGLTDKDACPLHLTRCIEAGADGLLLHGSAPHELTQAIREVENGDSPISPCIARSLLRHLRSQAHPAPPPPDFAPTRPADLGPRLSPRETEILHLLAKGLSYQDIAHTLGIATQTVTTHIKRLYKKMGVHSRGEAVFEFGGSRL